MQQQINQSGMWRLRMCSWRWLALAGISCLPLTAHAQMLSYSKGEAYSSVNGEVNPAYKIEYRQMLYQGFSVTFDYVNEGHYTGHHPDGYSLEFWYQHRLSEKYRLHFGAGIGPYYYFDTITPAGGQSIDAHGLAPVVTLSARGKLWRQWDWVVSADSIDPAHDVKAQMLSLGIGYWLSDSASPAGFFERAGNVSASNDPDELSAYGVISVINISSNPESWGASVEYRHRFAQHFDGTLTYIYEGDPRVARRSGFAAQLWPVRSDVKSGIEIGAGFGAYAFIDRKQQPIPGQISSTAAAPLVSLMASYPARSNWFVRAIWDRVVSNYSRDADIWRLGVGRTL